MITMLRLLFLALAVSASHLETNSVTSLGAAATKYFKREWKEDFTENLEMFFNCRLTSAPARHNSPSLS
jgi:hypothetical protein